MPGPKPKDPTLRQRRNKPSTFAELDPDGGKTLKAPPLTKEILGVPRIAPPVHRWWRVVWRSPMAPRWLEADIEVLYLVAILRNEFAEKRTPTLAAEIRQQEGRLGLDVMARRRADWRISGPAQAQPSRAAAAKVAVEPDELEDEEDPRLRLVK